MERQMIINRVRAGPSAWTFKIKPIAELLSRYIPEDGEGWVDPFAGNNSPAEFTNDHNPEKNARWHMEAEAFCKMMATMSHNTGVKFKGGLIDPPYSYRQITEHYQITEGRKAHSIETTSNFYNKVMNAICDSIEPGGYAISFGWNSNGFGKNRGFGDEPIEILIVAHGQHHNDTIVTVERKAME
jgi:hypothetical protein